MTKQLFLLLFMIFLGYQGNAQKKDSVKLEEVTVEGKRKNKESEAILNIGVKEAEIFKQNIGSEELSRKGIGDVQEGVTKITGITYVENRGLFIRGLEDRYNNLLINNLAVPSNNPFKKIIALDLISSDVVGVLEVFKTFNPDIYGDFAGGTINVLTTEGRKNMTKINFGISMATDNNFSDFLIAPNALEVGNYFGFNTKERELPEVFGSKPSFQNLSGEEAVNSFKSGFDTHKITSPINSSYGFITTGKIKANETSNWTYVLTGNYENKYQIKKGVDRTFNQSQGNYDNNLERAQYNFKTLLTGLAGINFNSNRFKAGANVFYIRSNENIIQDQLGYTNSQVNNTNVLIRTNERQIADFFNVQVEGEYDLTENKKHNIKAAGSYTLTSLSQPDRNFITGEKIADNEISMRYGGNLNLLRQYLSLDGKGYYSGLLEYNWRFGKNEDFSKLNRLSIGYNGYAYKMVSSYRFIYGRPTGNVSTFDADLLEIDSYINSDLLDNRLSFNEESTEQYKAQLIEAVNAGYATLFLKFGEKTELNVGVRVENTQKEIGYRELGTSILNPYTKELTETVDILPSLNFKYLLNEKSNLRFAASKTITRPVIMEAFPLEYVNGDGTVELGNKELVNSENYNFDLRYEVFPTNKELISITAFGKYLDSPIERGFLASGSSGGQITSYFNAKNAIILGGEFELLLDLQRLSESLNRFSLGFNSSLMWTQVETDREVNTIETFDKRELQGASPWLINADIKYQFNFNEEWKNTLSLVYSVFGKRIYAVGTSGFDNIYEMPFNELDFIWNSKINKNWEVKFKVDNILNPDYLLKLGNDNEIVITESSLDMRSYKKGVGFGLSATYTF